MTGKIYLSVVVARLVRSMNLPVTTPYGKGVLTTVSKDYQARCTVQLGYGEAILQPEVVTVSCELTILPRCCVIFISSKSSTMCCTNAA